MTDKGKEPGQGPPAQVVDLNNGADDWSALWETQRAVLNHDWWGLIRIARRKMAETAGKPKPSNDPGPDLQAYLEDRRAQGVMPSTLEGYKRVLGKWLAFAGLEGGDAETALEYIGKCFSNDRTRRSQWATIKAFVRWRARRGQGEDWTGRVRFNFKPARPPLVLTLAEAQQLLEGIPDDNAVGRRDKALFSVLFYGAARISEIVTLPATAVYLDDGMIAIIGKGGGAKILSCSQRPPWTP